MPVIITDSIALFKAIAALVATPEFAAVEAALSAEVKAA